MSNHTTKKYKVCIFFYVRKRFFWRIYDDLSVSNISRNFHVFVLIPLPSACPRKFMLIRQRHVYQWYKLSWERTLWLWSDESVILRVTPRNDLKNVKYYSLSLRRMIIVVVYLLRGFHFTTSNVPFNYVPKKLS